MISKGNIPRYPRIDGTLQALGAATPPPGMEGRILTRVAAERLHMEAAPGSASWLPILRQRMPRGSAPALGFASAGLVCALMVVGSVTYSHRSHGAPVPVPVTLQTPSQAIGAAAAVHPAAPASSPVVAGPQSRGRSARHAKHGRARVQPQATKAPGVIVPVPSSAPPN